MSSESDDLVRAQLYLTAALLEVLRPVGLYYANPMFRERLDRLPAALRETLSDGSPEAAALLERLDETWRATK